MATECHRPERRAARILPGAAPVAARRLLLLGVFVVLGWCGLAMASGASASAAEAPGSAQGSSSLLGSGTIGDVLDEATSAVRSAGNHTFDIVTIKRSDRPSARSGGAPDTHAAATRSDENSRSGTDPAPGRLHAANRSVLALVPAPVRGLTDSGVSAPVDLAVSTVDRTLGHVAEAPLGSAAEGLVVPLDGTVSHGGAGLTAAHPGASSAGVAAPYAGSTGRAAPRTASALTSTSDVRDGEGALVPGADTAPRAGVPAGHHNTPSAPAAGGAPAMPFGVAGGSAPGNGSGNAGASGAYLDFAGVRPSAASGPVWTVRHNDEQVPLDDPDRPRVSPD